MNRRSCQQQQQQKINDILTRRSLSFLHLVDSPALIKIFKSTSDRSFVHSITKKTKHNLTMFHNSFILLSFVVILFTMTRANPCPCEVIASEPLANNPSSSISDSTIDDLMEKKFLEEYLERLSASETSAESYPLFRQGKSLDLAAQRNKRPSWAAVGKRAASLISKRPSWAQVG